MAKLSSRQRLATLCALALQSAPFCAWAAASPQFHDPALAAAEKNAFEATVKIESRSKLTGAKRWSGTGFYPKGYPGLIVTNNHVASDGALNPEDTVLVAIGHDGRETQAIALSFDLRRDVAILRAPAPSKAAIELAEQLPELGEQVTCAGFPMSQPFTFIDGRFVRLLDSASFRNLMLSASTDPGVSGGPTLNRKLQAIGANVAGEGRSVAYSVPADALREQLEKASKVQSPPDAQAMRQIALAQALDAAKGYAQDFFASARPVALGSAVALVPDSPGVACSSRENRSDKTKTLANAQIGCRSEGTLLSFGNAEIGQWRIRFEWSAQARQSLPAFLWDNLASSGAGPFLQELDPDDPGPKACRRAAWSQNGANGFFLSCLSALGQEKTLRNLYFKTVAWDGSAFYQASFAAKGVPVSFIPQLSRSFANSLQFTPQNGPAHGQN